MTKIFLHFALIFILLPQSHDAAAGQKLLRKKILKRFGVRASRFREVETGQADAAFLGMSPQQQAAASNQLLVDTLPPSLEATSSIIFAQISTSVKRHLDQMKATCGGEGQQVDEAVWHIMVTSVQQVDPERAYVSMTVQLSNEQLIECIFDTKGQLLQKQNGSGFEAAEFETERPGFSLGGPSANYSCQGLRHANNNLTDDCIHLTVIDQTEECTYKYRNISLHYLDRKEPHKTMCYIGRHLPDQEANDCSYVVSGFRSWLEKTAMLGINEPLGVERNFGEEVNDIAVHFGYRKVLANYLPFNHQISIGSDTQSFCRCPDLLLHELFHAFFISKISPTVITWEARLITEMLSDIGGIALAMRLFPDRYVGGRAASNDWHLAHECTNRTGLRNRDIRQPNLSAGYMTNYNKFVESILSNFSNGLSFSDPLTFSGAAYKGSTILSHVFYDLAASKGKREIGGIFYTWLMAAVTHFHERISLPEMACKLAETTDRIHGEFSPRLRRKLSAAGFDVSSTNCRTFPRKDCEIVDEVNQKGVKEVRYEGDYKAFTLCHNGRNFTSECSNTRKWRPEITTETCHKMVERQNRIRGTCDDCEVTECPAFVTPSVCTPPSPPINGRIKPIYKSNNVQVWQLECDSGYQLPAGGSKEFIGCMEEEIQTPICESICVQYDAPENGYVTPLTNQKDWFEFSCREGFELIGQKVVNCRSPSKERPICKQGDCNAPMALANGDVVFSRFSRGSIAVFTCREGFVLPNKHEMMVTKCDKSTLKWIPYLPSTCQPVITDSNDTVRAQHSDISFIAADRILPLDCQWYEKHRANTTKPAKWTYPDSQRYFGDGCVGGDLPIVKEMVAKWGDRIVEMGWGSEPCLAYAAENSHLNIVRYLIEEKGANVNLGSQGDKRPIHYASYGGKLDMVKYLVAAGARINTIDSVEMTDDGCKGGNSLTPLDMAIYAGNQTTVVDYLIVVGGRCNCYFTEDCEYETYSGLEWQYCPN